MNKTIIININGIVFHIEEDAYETLRSYMIDIKRHFGKSEDSKEILEDIENRIAEMFSERIESGRKEVINNEDVNDVIAQMGRVSDFDTADESYGEGYTNNRINNNQLFYPLETAECVITDDTVISGVCSGIGHYVGLEACWVRLLFVLFVLLGGSGILAYVILWIIMPVAVTRADKMEMRGEAPNLQNFKKNFEEEMSGFRENFSGAGDSLSQGVRSAGDVIVKILTVFVKAIGLVIAFSIGLSLLGLLIAVIFFAFGISGFSDNGIMYPVNFMEPNQAYIALIAAAFAIAIPMIAVFYSIIRVLFNKGSMNKIMYRFPYSLYGFAGYRSPRHNFTRLCQGNHERVTGRISVERIQIIDRDESGLTSKILKSEQSVKVLNVVTKGDKSAGKMYDISLEGGTQDHYKGQASLRTIDGKDQRSYKMAIHKDRLGLKSDPVPGPFRMTTNVVVGKADNTRILRRSAKLHLQNKSKSAIRAKNLADGRSTFVYGGGHVGLMGAVANGALAQGGEVIGVIPDFLNSKEIGHKGVTQLHVVEICTNATDDERP
ncbi:hypothetical protein FQR65_LT16028 [Abscondita terminalis]|nr:hypothetical protein FQR65_LT16028 [Abscondita terminalis]